jgi:hypothetical protein
MDRRSLSLSTGIYTLIYWALLHVPAFSLQTVKGWVLSKANEHLVFDWWHPLAGYVVLWMCIQPTTQFRINRILYRMMILSSRKTKTGCADCASTQLNIRLLEDKICPRNRVLLHKLRVAQFVKKFPVLYRTRRLSIVLTHLYLSWARLIQSYPDKLFSQDQF